MKKNNYKGNLEFIINEPTLLLEYLLKSITNKSKNNIKSMLSRGNILVDGKETTKFDYHLKVGQVVTIKTAQIFDNESNDILDILYEDDDLIVINKPEGLLSISTEAEKTNTAYHKVMNYLKRKNYRNRIFVVHRLDSDTSGVLMFAKNEKIKFALQDNWNDLVSVRGYMAVVEGIVPEATGTIKSWLRETKTLLVYSSYTPNDGLEAITNYKKINNSKDYTLLEINIETGRKNQIRVHMKDIKHNIVGDKKYGAKSDPLKRLGLHAHVIEFKHPFTNKMMRFEADVPQNFISITRKNS